MKFSGGVSTLLSVQCRNIVTSLILTSEDIKFMAVIVQFLRIIDDEIHTNNDDLLHSRHLLI